MSTIAISVTPIQPFDLHGDSSAVYQKWEKWIRSFELFTAASGCEKPEQKRQLLLHSAGPDTQDIFFTFNPEPQTYEETKAALNNYFRPAVNIPYQRHVFRQAKQQESENVTQYATRLRQLAKTCNFGEQEEDFIRDQIIDKCNSTQLRTKLLAEKNLSLSKCLELAQAKELSEKQSSSIASTEKVFAAHTLGHSRQGNKS